jgi:hypothetical protein
MGSQVFHVNYFVGAVLAQGGDLRLEDTKIVFSPTSSIDRALGAKDVEIPLNTIRGVEYAGGLTRTFRIKTDDKTHKFVGQQVEKIWQILQNSSSLKSGIAPSPKTPATLECGKCAGPLKPNFLFCPYCGGSLTSSSRAA